jgi:hypothetical protein
MLLITYKFKINTCNKNASALSFGEAGTEEHSFDSDNDSEKEAKVANSL